MLPDDEKQPLLTRGFRPDVCAITEATTHSNGKTVTTAFDDIGLMWSLSWNESMDVIGEVAVGGLRYLILRVS